MATSCESGRTQAYSPDLRWRMVYQAMVLNKASREIAKNLNVDQSTVSRTVKLFNEQGDVTKKSYPANEGTRKLTQIDQLVILELVIDRPGIYLHELQQEIFEETGTEVDCSTICRFLSNSGFTRQKMILAAKQRCELMRAQYQLETSVYLGHPELLIFVDETGADRRDCLRRCAYGMKGIPAVARKFTFRGDRVNAICAISMDGLLDFYTTTSSVNSDKFLHFIEHALIPHLQPFNGSNKRSVVIMDNATIHHQTSVVGAIQSTGALLHFLPPYSPDFNAIELAFSKVKSVLKSNESAWEDMDTETAMISALNTVTAEDCQAWIDHCGY